ncbi:hypothetical protein [Robertmurraya massiliosenegalensis]|uniref:hypothetical protein n=1 Tax=Robertmurraya massiliosenegalensis TaxID=1287657 RepID=UPI0002FFFC93|nr:hypothetical protein [Robertmurraya massiliosenegalensis]
MKEISLQPNKQEGDMNMELVENKGSLIKKILIVLLAVLVLSLGIGQVISHQFNLELTNVAEASLKSKVSGSNLNQLEKTVDSAGNTLVKFARDIAIVVAIILIMLMAYSLFIKKSAEGLADMKGRMGGLILAIALIFFTEQILGAILGIFGVKI